MKKTILLCLAASLAAAIALHQVLLAGLGACLVHADPPRKADLVLVLGGDPNGSRILKASELVKLGFAPRIVVSGPSGFYDNYECDLEIPFAERRGFPESYVVHFEHHAHSTFEEARVTTPEIRRLGAKSVLLVTSDYHTRRAGRIFRRVAPDLNFIVIAAPDEFFSPAGWWKNREGRKTCFIEWLKTVSQWFGI